MNNNDDKKLDQAKDAAATGLGPVHNKPGAGGPPMYGPFDPVPGDLPPYPSHPGFSPGYPPAHPEHPGGPAYPGYPNQPGFAPPCQGMQLARAYICIQSWGKVNSPARALETGTLFPELYRPYPY